MKILAHSGHWLELSEQDSFVAFEHAWANGFGIETSLRDLNGLVVVSHNPPRGVAPSFESLLQAYAKRGQGTPLALNIRSDGLQGSVTRLLEKYGVTDAFLFGMPVPDGMSYLAAGMPVFVRQSEHEPETPLIARAAGIWLDAFESEWWTPDLVRSLCARGKSVAVVSPELHRRPHQGVWAILRSLPPDVRKQVFLCTDFPDDAAAFFER